MNYIKKNDNVEITEDSEFKDELGKVIDINRKKEIVMVRPSSCSKTQGPYEFDLMDIKCTEKPLECPDCGFSITYESEAIYCDECNLYVCENCFGNIACKDCEDRMKEENRF